MGNKKAKGDRRQPLLEEVALGETDEGRQVVYKQQLQQQQMLLNRLSHIGSLIAVFTAESENSGNIIAWSCPSSEQALLAGIEFKAIATGMHNLAEDYVLFTHGETFGLAAFHRMASDAHSAHMQAVGALSHSLEGLRQHLPFLIAESRDHSNDETQRTRLFTHLEAHGGSSRARLGVILEKQMPVAPLEMPPAAMPTPGAITRLIHHFRKNLFVLWKAMHLGKRIMLYSPAPMGPVCERILAACAIMRHSFPRPQITQADFVGPYPIFNVSASDCDELHDREKYPAYLACTADRVLEYRVDICDVWINNQEFHVRNDNQALQITDTDEKHFNELLGILGTVPLRDTSGLSTSEASVQLFFVEMNNQLHRALEDAYHHQVIRR
eukprot:TRINITY_DN9288_c0_g1_i5.p1 TRINITY_DN9288_c0_g1~~TRINITY_DN9288_c0_g1_i5.p1  ORF type:complete len:383 (+),score=68.72 TRINITY_DN9288_c0_g1_i5:192-1340(+)